MLMKICGECKEEKELSEFHKNSTKAFGVANTCKLCRKKYHNKWYSENKELQKSRVKKANKKVRRENRKRLWDYLLTHPCVDCSESRPQVLEFDHVRGKKRKDVSSMMDYSWATILDEIAKCDVRCANCHKMKTCEQFGYYSYL